MITELLRIVQTLEDDQGSEAIAIAKGKYQYPKNFKAVWSWFKREIKNG